MRKFNSKQLNLNTFEALWSKILPPAYKTVVNFFFCSPSKFVKMKVMLGTFDFYHEASIQTFLFQRHQPTSSSPN